MSPLAKNFEERYTYNDYLNWNDGERWEIINGVAYNMSPSPTPKHQRIGLIIKKTFLVNEKKLKKCFLFDAPTDVVFDEYNVVQPDIFIVCDKNKIKEKNIQGAPDLIIEITSPSTELKDRREKLNLYEKFEVKEYIIVNSEREYVERYYLTEEGKYKRPEIFNWDEVLKLKTFEIEIKLWEIFEKEKQDK